MQEQMQLQQEAKQQAVMQAMQHQQEAQQRAMNQHQQQQMQMPQVPQPASPVPAAGGRRSPSTVDPIERIAQRVLASQSPAAAPASQTQGGSSFDDQIVGMLANVMTQLQSIQQEVFQTRNISPNQLQDALVRRGASPTMAMSASPSPPPASLAAPSPPPVDFSVAVPEDMVPPTSQEADDAFSFMCRSQLQDLRTWFASAHQLRPGSISDVEAVSMLQRKAKELADSRHQARRQLNAAEHAVIVSICECKDAREAWESASNALQAIDEAATRSQRRVGVPPERDALWTSLLKAREEYTVQRKRMAVAQVRSNQLAFLSQQLAAALQEVEQRLSQMAILGQYVASTGRFGSATHPRLPADVAAYPSSPMSARGSGFNATSPASPPSAAADQWLYGYGPSPARASPSRYARATVSSPAAVSRALTLPAQHVQSGGGQGAWRESLSYF